MAGVNKAILVGNLGRDPQLDYTSAGTARCRFSIATTEQFTDREGQRQERTEWHNIVLWGKLGEIAGEYLKKGRQVYIEGQIRTRQYEDRDGQQKWITEIVGREMQMLGGPRGGNDGDSVPPPGEEEYASGSKSSGGGQRRESGGGPQRGQGGGMPAEDEDDDLPF